jgi:hypothetical protein
MSENQLVVRRYFQDVVSQAGIDVIDGTRAEDYIEYDPVWAGGRVSGDHVIVDRRDCTGR